jgi:hypothetical protein
MRRGQVGSGVYLGAPGLAVKLLVGRVGSNPRPADYEKRGFVHRTR